MIIKNKFDPIPEEPIKITSVLMPPELLRAGERLMAKLKAEQESKGEYEDKVVEMARRGSVAWKLNRDDVWKVFDTAKYTAVGGLGYAIFRAFNEDWPVSLCIIATVLCSIGAGLARRWIWEQ